MKKIDVFDNNGVSDCPGTKHAGHPVSEKLLSSYMAMGQKENPWGGFFRYPFLIHSHIALYIYYVVSKLEIRSHVWLKGGLFSRENNQREPQPSARLTPRNTTSFEDPHGPNLPQTRRQAQVQGMKTTKTTRRRRHPCTFKTM